MAIDLGSSNSTRYHSVPDHADFTLPNGDWAWLALCYPQSSGDTKYVISTGAFGAANSVNLYCYHTGTTLGWGSKVDGLAEINWSGGYPSLDLWHWTYVTRRSGNLFVGAVPLNGSLANESVGLAISAAYDSTTAVHICARTGLAADRFWKGRWGQVAFVSGAGITAAQAVELAKGAPLLGMPFAPSIKFLLHGRSANDATITDLIGGHVATRQGTGYGTSEEDAQTPYAWAPEYSRGAEAAPPASSPIAVFINHYRNQGIM